MAIRRIPMFESSNVSSRSFKSTTSDKLLRDFDIDLNFSNIRYFADVSYNPDQSVIVAVYDVDGETSGVFASVSDDENADIKEFEDDDIYSYEAALDMGVKLANYLIGKSYNDVASKNNILGVPAR